MTYTVRAALTGVLACVLLASCSADNTADDVGRIEIQEAGLAFELPAEWVELDLEEARQAVGDDDLMAVLVERHGPDTKRFGPVEVFISTATVPLAGAEPVFVASAKGVENDVLAQMTVTVSRVDALPSVAELEQTYREHPLGVVYLDLDEIETPVGSAVLAVMSMSHREPIWHWGRLTVDTGSVVVEISLLSDDRAKTEQLASDLADSLESTG